MSETQPIPDDWTSKWTDNQPFEIHSSGSTGSPKPHTLRPQYIRWSAEQTRKHFIRSSSLHQLLALPLDKVGGFMQWARAQTWQSPIDITAPSANPLLSYTGGAKITSLTPMQIEGILNHPESRKKLLNFESILIGGAPISGETEERLLLEFSHIHWVHTFGMTETYSHFAGRVLGQKEYSTVDDTDLLTNEIGLQVKNPCTEHQWMQTHDLVQIKAPNRFVWIGRSDFTINSGGIKIQLETVEREIQAQTQWPASAFFCWWESDSILGQKLVLFVKKDLPIPKDWQFSSRYFQPKQIYTLHEIIYTATGKISRAESAALSVK